MLQKTTIHIPERVDLRTNQNRLMHTVQVHGTQNQNDDIASGILDHRPNSTVDALKATRENEQGPRNIGTDMRIPEIPKTPIH